MTAIGNKREKFLWQVITGSDYIKDAYEDIFLELKEEILKIDVRNGNNVVDEDSKNVETMYIAKEVLDTDVVKNFGHEYNIEKNKVIGNQYIRELKRETCEPDNYLTYEHLLSANIAHLKRPILLVGPHGSGKTLKLRYIWYRYIRDHEHCLSNLCKSKNRVRILLDIMSYNFNSPKDLYEYIYRRVFYSIESELGDSFGNKYDNYLNEILYRFTKGEILPFFTTLRFLGLSPTKKPSFEDFCRSAKKRNDFEDLVTFSLMFCEWVEKKFCPNDYTCVFLIFDNIDGASKDIQRAIISILEKSFLKISIICACRPETLKNWKYYAIPIFTVPHLGPTAHQVVLGRIDSFLKTVNEDDLGNKLKNLINPKEYISNLSLISKNLNSSHFISLFQNLFGCQIREGLRYAQGIIDAAASRDKKSLQFIIEEKSDHALERILFRPWGLKSHKLRIVNIFQQGKSMRFRLSGVRILKFLDFENSSSIEEIYNYLSIFGFSAVDTINILEEMLKSRLIIAATKEFPKIDSYDECKSEKVSLTDSGEGLIKHGYQLGYIETTMYYCKCNENNYQSLKKDRDPGLKVTLKILRNFIKETFEIEMKELINVKRSNELDFYLTIYNGKSVVLEILSEVLKSLVKIWNSEKKKQLHQFNTPKSMDSLFDIAKDIKGDLFYMHNIIERDIQFTHSFDLDVIEAIEFFEEKTTE